MNTYTHTLMYSDIIYNFVCSNSDKRCMINEFTLTVHIIVNTEFSTYVRVPINYSLESFICDGLLPIRSDAEEIGFNIHTFNRSQIYGLFCNCFAYLFSFFPRY